MHTSMCCSADARVHKLEWFQGTGPKQIPDHAHIASVLSRLLRRHPPPADPHQALPTPTAAVWESMHTSVDILLMTRGSLLRWNTHPTSQAWEASIPSLRACSPCRETWQQCHTIWLEGTCPTSALMLPSGELLCSGPSVCDCCLLQEISDGTTGPFTLPCSASVLT